MQRLFPTKSPRFASEHRFGMLFNVEVPVPALQRGWLHGRELTQPWDIERIVARIGDRCWFSHYHRDPTETDPSSLKFAPHAVAGFWPDGGFMELQMQGSGDLDAQPVGVLGLYTDSPARTEALMRDLIARYRRAPAVHDGRARVGMLNYAFGRLTVERIAVTSDQSVPREHLDRFYREGAAAWVAQWIGALTARRYGLTVLTGPPGTGKTTLLRSLAHWLADTHVFYFMPAARFSTIESGELVTFWAGENRTSRLRKILVLEDAEGILLRRGDDNRDKVATLLNLTDGMLGDALGLHVIGTLNSELADLDPALLRPGRLIAHREFELLNADEARALAELLEVPVPRGDRVSLAEFFNRGSATTAFEPPRRKTLGFHALLHQTT